MARFSRALFVCAFFAHSSVATAGELGWNGPAECRREREIADEVESLAGHSLASVAEYDFAVEVERRSERHWKLVLVTTTRASGATSERRFEGASCVEVGDAAAVAISMTLRNAAAGAIEATEPRPEEPAPPVPAPTPVTSVRRDAAPARARKASRERAAPVGVRLGLGALVDTGSLPNVAPGGSASASLLVHPLRFELEGASFAPQNADTAQDRGGEFGLALGALVTCFERTMNGPRGVGCLGYELGRLSGVGFGVSDPRTGSALWQAIRLELGAGVPLSKGLSLSLRAGAAIPLGRRTFVLDEGEVVHESSAVTGRAEAGLEISL